MERISTKKRVNWVPTVISIFIGALITVGATWFTIYKARQAEDNAEVERISKIKENVTSIIEEHIVNRDTLNLISLDRLIHITCSEENIKNRPSLYNLLSLSEYNIQISNHLSFEKKHEYSLVIQSLFEKLANDSVSITGKSQYTEIVNEISKSLNESKKLQGKQSLLLLVEKYESDITKLESEIAEEKINMNILTESPYIIFLSVTIYLSIMLVFYIFYRGRKRKKQILFARDRAILREKESVRKEIDYLMSKLNSKKLTDEERKRVKEQLNRLMDNYKKSYADFRHGIRYK